MPKRRSLEISELLASYGLPVLTFSLICTPVVGTLVFVPVPNVQTADNELHGCHDQPYPAVSRLHSALQLDLEGAKIFTFISSGHLLMTFPIRIALGNPGTGAAVYPAKGKVLSAGPWFVGPFGGLASPRQPATGLKRQPFDGAR
jgi:hypothetical protein